MSRIIAGKLHLSFDVVDLKAVVASAVAACKLTLDKGIEVREYLGDGDAFVLGTEPPAASREQPAGERREIHGERRAD